MRDASSMGHGDGDDIGVGGCGCGGAQGQGEGEPLSFGEHGGDAFGDVIELFGSFRDGMVCRNLESVDWMYGSVRCRCERLDTAQTQGQATYILIDALSRSRSVRAQCINITANMVEYHMRFEPILSRFHSVLDL